MGDRQRTFEPGQGEEETMGEWRTKESGMEQGGKYSTRTRPEDVGKEQTRPQEGQPRTDIPTSGEWRDEPRKSYSPTQSYRQRTEGTSYPESSYLRAYSDPNRSSQATFGQGQGQGQGQGPSFQGGGGGYPYQGQTPREGTYGGQGGGEGMQTQSGRGIGTQMGRGMESQPLLVIFGATGKQGYYVLKSLMNEGRFRLRTLSRNVEAKKAQKLKKKWGVEIFQGNMHKREDLRNLLQGAHGVFALTNFWDPESMGKEEQLGKQIAEVAKECGVKHFVWSTLPNVEKMTGGTYHVPHFTDKARVNSVIKRLGFEFYTFVMPSFYYQNFATLVPPRREGGTLVWTLPMPESSYLSAFDVRDLGPVVAKIFKEPETYNRKKIPLIGAHLHPQNFIVELGLISKMHVKVELVHPREYLRLTRTPHAEEMLEMFMYFTEYGYYGPNCNIEESKKLFPELKSWPQYLKSELEFVKRKGRSSTWEPSKERMPFEEGKEFKEKEFKDKDKEKEFREKGYKGEEKEFKDKDKEKEFREKGYKGEEKEFKDKDKEKEFREKGYKGEEKGYKGEEKGYKDKDKEKEFKEYSSKD